MPRYASPVSWWERLLVPGAADPQHPAHPGWPQVAGSVVLRERQRSSAESLPGRPDTSHAAASRPASRPAGLEVLVRPMTAADGPAWRHHRIADEALLRPTEPTGSADWASAHSEAGWKEHFRYLRRSAQIGELLPFAIEVQGNFAGQVSIGGIKHGPLSEAWLGYWVFSRYTGMGVASAACALAVDHAFERAGIHRLTATHLPNNPASGRVLAAVGFRREGYLRRNLHIDGAWRDHVLLGLVSDDYLSSAVERLRVAGKIR